VEIARGRMRRGSREVIDTPGINSLNAHSEDERVALEIVARERAAVLVQVADARNLARALALTLQLADLGRPLVLVVNLMDEAEAAGLKFEFARLEALLGCEVVPMVAVEGRGIAHLWRALERARIPRLAMAGAEPALPGAGPGAADKDACSLAAQYGCPWAAACPPGLAATALHPPGSKVWAQRERWLARQLPRIVRQAETGRLPWSEQLDAWLRYFPVGLLVMLAVAAALYAAVGMGAASVSDYLTQRVFAERFTPWLAGFLSRTGSPLLRDFLAGPYGVASMGLSYGLGLVLPVLVVFFFLFALMEDSGYLPRLAVLFHRGAEGVGLSGRAVMPLILGLGCGTMATVATRVLPTRRERVLAALLIALGVPCSAQLGVLLGLVAGLSIWAPIAVLGMVLLQMLWVGKLAARLLPGAGSDFLLELPPLRLPRPANLLRKTLLRVAWYFREAIPIFLAGTAILFVLDRLGLVRGLVALAEPVVARWLGLPPGAAIAFVMGFLRRDYGAAGLYALARAGQLDAFQIVIASVTLVLFIPCLANFLMLLKEFGARVALRVALTTAAVALLAGGLLHGVFSLL